MSRAPANVFGSISPSRSSHPRRTCTSPASKSMSSTCRPRSSPRRRPANKRQRPERLLRFRQCRDQRLGGRRGFDPRAAVPDDRHLQARARIDEQLVVVDRAPDDHPQRIKPVVHRRRRRTELSHLLDEALDVRATKRTDLPAPQQRVDVVLQRVLVAADGLGLVRLAAAIEDRSGSHPSHKRDAGLADGRRRRRTQPAAANRDNRLLLPRDRLGAAR